MISCKQVAHALADQRYWTLPWHRRVGLHIHVFLCFVCGRYHRQVMLMQRLAQAFRRHEQSAAVEPAVALSPEARARILKSLRGPAV